MKKYYLLINFIVLFLLISGCSRSVTYDDYVPMKDILKYAEDEYEIIEWYGDEYQITDENFMKTRLNDFKHIIRCFNKPLSSYDNLDYNDDHLYFLRVGKNKNNEYKYVVYNRHVKDGTKMKNAVDILDYHLPFDFDDVETIISEMKNEYYKDMILARELVIDVEALIDGRFELFINRIKDDRLNDYHTLKLLIEQLDGKVELIIEAKEKADSSYQIIYTSSEQSKIKKVVLNNENFNNYFTYGISHSVIQIIEEGQDVPFASTYIDLTKSDKVYYYNFNLGLMIKILSNKTTPESAGEGYHNKHIVNSERIQLGWFFEYDNFIETEIELVPRLRDVEGFVYIVLD